MDDHITELENEVQRLEDELHRANERISALESQGTLSEMYYSDATREEIWEAYKKDPDDVSQALNDHVYSLVMDQLQHPELWKPEDISDWEDYSVDHRLLNIDINIFDDNCSVYLTVPEGELHKKLKKRKDSDEWSIRELCRVDVEFNGERFIKMREACKKIVTVHRTESGAARYLIEAIANNNIALRKKPK